MSLKGILTPICRRGRNRDGYFAKLTYGYNGQEYGL